MQKTIPTKLKRMKGCKAVNFQEKQSEMVANRYTQAVVVAPKKRCFPIS